MQRGKLFIIRSFEKLSLIVVDLFAICLALYVAFALRKYVAPHLLGNLLPFTHTLRFYYSLFWIPLISLFFTYYNGLYTKTETFWEDAKAYLKSYIIGFIVIITLITLSKQSDRISRMVMTLFLINVLWINLSLRFLFKRFLFLFKAIRKDVLIIGAGSTGADLLRGLRRERYLGYHVVGFLDSNGEKGDTIEGAPVLGTMEDLDRVRRAYAVEKAFIALPSLSSDEMMDLYVRLRKYFREVVIVPRIRMMALMNSDIHYLFNNDLFLLNVKNNLGYGLNRFLKKFVDYFLAVFFFPLFLFVLGIVALLIKLESPGPVFYRHNRYSVGGDEITIFKFRSMYKDADVRLKGLLERDEELRREWNNCFKLKKDPRITKVGRVLRKTSLDELPQMLNVLKGEMSIIGPRPVVSDELEKYYARYGDYFENIKSGITGLWQISGRSDTNYEYRVRSDLWYVLNWSFWLDVVILLKTIIVVLKGKGAY